MNPQIRDKLRIATLVRQQLRLLHDDHCDQVQQQYGAVLGELDRLRGLHRRVEKARRRRWYAAAQRLSVVMQNVSEHVDQQMRTLQSSHAESTHSQRITDSFVADELDQLTEEFGTWRFDASNKELSVQTDAIELEGVYLGPFEIQLRLCDLSQLEQRQPYAIEALDPQLAASQDCVTHPHVSDKQLCAGEAVTPIRAALKTGRLCDFFILVQSVLTNYNAESPYVSLSEWFGEPCSDCGVRVNDDNRSLCRRCDEVTCDECSSICACCDDLHCADCSRHCPSCQESSCCICTAVCAQCDEPCCQLCLDDDLCPSCYQERENQYAKIQNESESCNTAKTSVC